MEHSDLLVFWSDDTGFVDETADKKGKRTEKRNEWRNYEAVSKWEYKVKISYLLHGTRQRALPWFLIRCYEKEFLSFVTVFLNGTPTPSSKSNHWNFFYINESDTSIAAFDNEQSKKNEKYFTAWIQMAGFPLHNK